MTEALPAALLLGSAPLLPAGAARGQTSLGLSCSPGPVAVAAATQPPAVQVDCIITLPTALGPEDTVSAALFYSPVNTEAFVGCSSSAGIPCAAAPKTDTFVCPSPGGCPAGSSYTLAIQLSSSSSREMFGELSLTAGLRAGATRSFVAMLPGWNLVALPPGRELFGVADPLFTLGPGDQGYRAVRTDAETAAGVGYWAFVPSSGVVTLPVGSDSPVTVGVPAGGWALVGNPSGIWSAGVEGADAIYFHDPVQGYQPAPPLLGPGRAAWVYSAQGGVVSVIPELP